MPKFHAYAFYTASKYLGEFEADTSEEARALADASGDTYASLCHQCAKEIELGDCYKIEVEPE